MKINNYFISKHDSLGRYLEVCDNVTTVLGYEKFEIIGVVAYDLFNPEFIREIVISHLSESLTKVEYQILTKSGNFIYVVTLSFKSMNDGDPNDFIYCLTRKMNLFEIIRLEFNRFLSKINRYIKWI